MSNLIGPTGPKGGFGAQGKKGDIGPTGPKGIDGFNGSNGQQGQPGPAGQKGDTGPQGHQGQKGDTGPQGPAGPEINESLISLKANLESPTFTGTVKGITSGMISDQITTISNSNNQDYTITSLDDGNTIFNVSLDSEIVKSPIIGYGLNGSTSCVCVVGTNIYIGGNFTTATNPNGTVITVNRICKYDTVTGLYSALGLGFENVCNTICAVGTTTLYIGGSFTTATQSNGTVLTVNRICKYDTVSGLYSALGLGLSTVCNTICSVGTTNLYIGGSFTTATQTSGSVLTVNRICRYDITGARYYALGSGLNSTCNTICLVGTTTLYIGGNFTIATQSNGIAATVNRICRYDITGATYYALSLGLNGTCNTICVSGTNLYIGGAFTSIVTQTNNSILTVNRICKYDINNNLFSSLGFGLLGGDCSTICLVETNLYIGGAFTSGIDSNNNVINFRYLCKYYIANSIVTPLGTLLSGTSSWICYVNSNLYIGGGFTSANNILVNYMCKHLGINLFYNTTYLNTININNNFELIKKNTINNKKYVTLINNNKKLIF